MLCVVGLNFFANLLLNISMRPVGLQLSLAKLIEVQMMNMGQNNKEACV